MFVRNREKRSKHNEDRDARVLGGASSSSGTEATIVVSASQSHTSGPSQRELRPRRARTDAHQMDVDESSGNDTEEDETYLRDPHEIAEDSDGSDADSDAESEREDMDEDGDDDSEDGSEESAAGSSDLEGPLVTPAIQVPVRQADVEMVSYYNTGMTGLHIC
jgi:hypothetical protein